MELLARIKHLAKPKVLIVGGAGYIGSHVAKEFSQHGYDPVVFDNFSTGHRWAVKFGSCIEGDLFDEEILYRALMEINPVAVIHLASLINVRDSIKDPAIYYEKNFGGALSLLKMMVKAKVKNLIFSSTAAVYGEPESLPILESHPKRPLNAYGKTKWAIEQMIEDFSLAYELNAIIFRFFNAAGADLEGMIGEAHEPETHLIPLILQTALGFKDVLEIYGDDFPTPDQSAVRDYIHVLDLASAHRLGVEYLQKQRGFTATNLGTGSGYSVKEVIACAEECIGKPIPVQIKPRLKNDSPALVADSSLANQILNWLPKHSDLKTMILSAYQWYANQGANL